MKNTYTVDGEVTYVDVYLKSVRYFRVLIDTEDLVKLEGLRISISVSKRNPTYYSPKVNGNRFKNKSMLLHRYLLDVPADKVTDHINGDTLDNRKANLRIVAQKDNVQNIHGAYVNNLSCGVRGVSWKTKNNRWSTKVQIDKQQYFLGLYDTVAEAQAVVEEFRRKHMPYSEMDKAA